MSGNVYIFNTTSTQLQLILNNTVVSTTLAGVTQSGGYAPTTISLDRNPASGNPQTDQFGGSNVLVVSYGSSGGTSTTFDVDISTSTYPIANDLQLYIFANIVVLEGANVGTSITGTQSATFFVGRKATEKEVAALKKPR